MPKYKGKIQFVNKRGRVSFTHKQMVAILDWHNIPSSTVYIRISFLTIRIHLHRVFASITCSWSVLARLTATLGWQRLVNAGMNRHTIRTWRTCPSCHSSLTGRTPMYTAPNAIRMPSNWLLGTYLSSAIKISKGKNSKLQSKKIK